MERDACRVLKTRWEWEPLWTGWRRKQGRTRNHGILSKKKLSPIEQSADVCNRGQINKAASAILMGNRCS